MAVSVTSTIDVSKSLQTSQLQSRLSKEARVIVPGDNGYDMARQAWNLSVDQYPAMILVAREADDIVESIRFAQAQGLDIAVKATGHGVIRKANNSLLIDTSKMTDVRVDAAAQTAWVSAGAKWGAVLERAQAVGLAPLLGSSPDVGAVGYTLGGGMGWLARKYGLSTDNVNFFELVTADGNHIRASHTENADLFWGLRGGGGNFGVVTGMEIKLYPITNVYAGNLFYPVANAKEVYAHYRRWIADAPDELTSSIVLMNFPPFPEVPEFLRGQSFVMIRGCYTGDLAQAEALLRHWRDWQTPLVDDFKTIPFSLAATISNDPVDPIPSLSSGAWLNNLSDDVIDKLIEYVIPRNGPPLLMFAEIRHAGGAIAKVDPGSAAYGNREAPHILQLVSAVPTPEVHALASQHIARLKDAIKPHLHGGVYMNFLEGAEARERTRQGFSAEAYARLQALKAKYDPKNVFSHSYDIAPARQ